MNLQQAGYQLARPVNSYPDLSLGAVGTASLCSGLGAFSLETVPYFPAGLAVFSGLIGVFLASAQIPFRYASLRLQQEVGRNESAFPLQFVERVTIADQRGLNALLERTALKEDLEWGTVLRSSYADDTARVEEILDSEESERRGFVYEGTSDSLRLNSNLIEEAGYNGDSHFHPSDFLLPAGSNFSVNITDRSKKLNWLNLLTFNMPSGPEVIAFNLNYTYIRSTGDQRELVRATPREIHEYLGGKKK